MYIWSRLQPVQASIWSSVNISPIESLTRKSSVRCVGQKGDAQANKANNGTEMKDHIRFLFTFPFIARLPRYYWPNSYDLYGRLLKIAMMPAAAVCLFVVVSFCWWTEKNDAIINRRHLVPFVMSRYNFRCTSPILLPFFLFQINPLQCS